MAKPGARGTWEWELHNALTGASWRRARLAKRPQTFPYHAYGYVVFRASTNRPYGRSRHAAGFLTHLTDEVLTAWRGGTLRGASVRWRCGSGTRHFELLDEPTSPICPACTIERIPRP